MTFNLSPDQVPLHIEDDDGDDGDVDDPWQNVHDDFQPLSSPTAPSRATSLTSALRGHFRYALGMMISLVMVVLKRMMMITVVMVVVMVVVVIVMMMMVVVVVMVMIMATTMLLVKNSHHDAHFAHASPWDS